MTRLFSPSGIAVIKLPKSGGVVESDESYRDRLAASQVREYFYGSGNSKAKPNSTNDETNDSEMDGSEKKPAMGFDDPITGVPTLSPHSTTLPLDLLEVYKIGQGEYRIWGRFSGGEGIFDLDFSLSTFLSFFLFQNQWLLLLHFQLEPQES